MRQDTEITKKADEPQELSIGTLVIEDRTNQQVLWTNGGPIEAGFLG